MDLGGFHGVQGKEVWQLVAACGNRILLPLAGISLAPQSWILESCRLGGLEASELGMEVEG